MILLNAECSLIVYRTRGAGKRLPVFRPKCLSSSGRGEMSAASEARSGEGG